MGRGRAPEGAIGGRAPPVWGGRRGKNRRRERALKGSTGGGGASGAE